jgi:hypothetical protein
VPYGLSFFTRTNLTIFVNLFPAMGRRLIAMLAPTSRIAAKASGRRFMTSMRSLALSGMSVFCDSPWNDNVNNRFLRTSENLA